MDITMLTTPFRLLALFAFALLLLGSYINSEPASLTGDSARDKTQLPQIQQRSATADQL